MPVRLCFTVEFIKQFAFACWDFWARLWEMHAHTLVRARARTHTHKGGVGGCQLKLVEEVLAKHSHIAVSCSKVSSLNICVFWLSRLFVRTNPSVLNSSVERKTFCCGQSISIETTNNKAVSFSLLLTRFLLFFPSRRIKAEKRATKSYRFSVTSFIIPRS